MTTVGTAYFVNFTKACDYYKDRCYYEISVSLLKRLVRDRVESCEIFIGKPVLAVGERLVLLDNGCRYGVES